MKIVIQLWAYFSLYSDCMSETLAQIRQKYVKNIWHFKHHHHHRQIKYPTKWYL